MALRSRLLDAVLGALAEAVTVHDEHGRTVYANPAAARLLLAESVEEVLAAAPGELAKRFIITFEDGSPVAVADFPGRRLMLGLPADPLLTRSVERASGRAHWMLTKAALVEDEDGRRLAVNVIEDVTEAKEAELRQRFRAEAGHALSASLDEELTLAQIARLVVPWLADWCSVELPDERGRPRQVALAHADPAKVDFAKRLSERYPPDHDAPRGVPNVLRTGRSELYTEIPDELLRAGARDDEHHELIKAVGIRAGMVVPMRSGGRTIGVITFVLAESRRTYDEADLAYAEDLALRAATAVENARLYSERAHIAATLQQSLLPRRLPELPGWELAASYRPGTLAADVGGDFYDVFAVPGGTMALIGNVTGKGVKAATLTSLVRHTARTAALFDPRPAAVLRLLNGVLREQEQLSLVTLACVLIEEQAAEPRLTMASAGHPLPARVRPGAGAPEPLGRHGLLLGALPDGPWEHDTRTLAAGDTVLLYTDGVTDLPGPGGRLGEQRLLELLATAPAGAQPLLDHVEAALQGHGDGTGADDRAMLALRYAGAPVKHAV